MGERGVLSVVADEYALASPRVRDPYGGGRWVMSRGWYDRVRACFVSEEQERDRARAHARLLIRVGDELSGCPACGLAVAGSAGLLLHVALFMDPGFREPSSLDRLFGLPVAVEGDGAPRLVGSG